MTVPAASWTAEASEPTVVTVPVCTLMVDTDASESPDGLMPPRTVRPLLPATTVSRDTGTGNCHASTPASTESGAIRCTGRELLAEAPRTGGEIRRARG